MAFELPKMKFELYYTLDKDHIPHPTDLEGFIKQTATLEERERNRRVGEDSVHGAWISTVFLYLDHGFSFGEGPPILFETMIFGSWRRKHKDYQERYCTWEQAVEGHKRAVEMVRKDLRFDLIQWVNAREITRRVRAFGIKRRVRKLWREFINWENYKL